MGRKFTKKEYEDYLQLIYPDIKEYSEGKQFMVRYLNRNTILTKYIFGLCKGGQ